MSIILKTFENAIKKQLFAGLFLQAFHKLAENTLNEHIKSP